MIKRYHPNQYVVPQVSYEAELGDLVKATGISSFGGLFGRRNGDMGIVTQVEPLYVWWVGEKQSWDVFDKYFIYIGNEDVNLVRERRLWIGDIMYIWRMDYQGPSLVTVDEKHVLVEDYKEFEKMLTASNQKW